MKKPLTARTGIRQVAIATTACLSFIGCNALADFSGDSTGTFVNPQPATGITVTGVGTSTFTWGLGEGSPPNKLTYASTAFSGVPAETPFQIGTLTYFNGTTEIGTTPNSIDLNLVVNFTDPAGVNQNFDYTMQLISTPNTGDAQQNADYVILSTFPSTTFTVDGVTYTMALGFQGTSSGGFGFLQGSNEFFVEEGKTASADLFGTITTDITGVVPEANTDFAGVLMLLPFGAGAASMFRNRRLVAS